MTAIHIDRKLDDDTRRKLIYDGDLFVYSPNEHSMALVELARGLIADAFPGIDPRTAQFRYDVKQFAAVLSKLKPAVIHHPDGNDERLGAESVLRGGEVLPGFELALARLFARG